jgi:hypothetical protein
MYSWTNGVWIWTGVADGAGDHVGANLPNRPLSFSIDLMTAIIVGIRLVPQPTRQRPATVNRLIARLHHLPANCASQGGEYSDDGNPDPLHAGRMSTSDD